MNLRKLIFSNRSFTPIPLVITLIYFSSFKTPFAFIGIIIAFLGESIRISSVRFAGGATRTLKVGAPSLCMSGPYHFTRNPLYLGNMTIYLGFVLFSGGDIMWELFLATFVFFTFQYSMIISLEEKTLDKKFGNAYLKYKSNVPRLFPRFSIWESNDLRTPIPLKKVFSTEKRSLQNICLFTVIIIIKNYYHLFIK